MFPIVSCIDSRYVLPYIVLVESIASQTKALHDEVELVVLHESLTNSDKRLIRTQADRHDVGLSVLRVDSSDAPYPATSGGIHGDQLTPAIYLRLMIADVLTDCSRALYLDADVLVKGDISPLFALPLNGRSLAAAQDPIQPTLGQGYALPGWEDEGVSGDRQYFNSGVLLFDLDVCRSEDLFGLARDFLVKYPDRALCLDQDALNWAADDHWVRLDRTWNTYTLQAYEASTLGPERLKAISMEQIRADEKASRILHFAGPKKPWLASEADNTTESYLVYRGMMAAALGGASPRNSGE